VTPKEDLIEAAMALRGAASDDWLVFLAAMREYDNAQTAEMLKCDPAVLVRAQGMAIAVRELTSLFLNAPQLHQKMQEKKRHG
jgi:hypothetical protein